MTPKRMSSAIGAALAVPALALGLIVATTGNAAAGHATARHSRAALTAKTAAGTRTVVTNCQGKPQVRPGSLVLACADGNDYLTGLSWTGWAPGLASAKGTEHLNDCVPYCAKGKFHTYPVIAVLWGSAAAAHHPGQKRYTEITLIYPGARPPAYKNGKMVPGPQTITRPI